MSDQSDVDVAQKVRATLDRLLKAEADLLNEQIKNSILEDELRETIAIALRERARDIYIKGQRNCLPDPRSELETVAAMIERKELP